MDCIFCKILAGQAPAQFVYRDDLVSAFRDIHPTGPVHLLIIPNRHIASVNDLQQADEAVMGHLFSVARKLAQQVGVDQTGYRLIVNTGPDTGQAIFHIHMHLIGGKRLRSLVE